MHKFVGSKWGCNVYKGRYLVLWGQKNEKNVCYLKEQSLKKISGEKKVKFSDDIYKCLRILIDVGFVESQFKF